MIKYILTLFCLTLISQVYSQTLKGKVYDDQTTVKGAKVINKSQNRLTGTNSEGDFTINAKVNDTISIESLFHHNQSFVVTLSHFQDPLVIELKKDIQELDEVYLTNEPEQPVFEEETYNTNLQQAIKEDIRKNPHLYSPCPTEGPDLIALVGMVARLFKKKKKKITVAPPITYEQLESLVSKSSLINKRFISEDLKIPEVYIPLFLEYCEAKHLSSDLLSKEKEFYLLDEIISNSEEFLKIIEEFKSQEIIKD